MTQEEKTEMSLQFRDLHRQYEHIKGAVDSSIQSVINSTAFISGKPVKELEQTLADYVGIRHCITCGNGTDAITIALRAIIHSNLEFGQGKSRENVAVFVPDFTFFSSGECPAGLGLTTFFVDVKMDTFNIAPEALERSISLAVELGYRPAILIAVDLFGQPAEYAALRAICDKYGMVILEDGAQGFGGSIDIFDASIVSGTDSFTGSGASIGDKVLNGRRMACSFGDISTTSFFPAKPLGCYGDGGAIFTDNDDWADLCRSIAVHGKDTSNPSDPMAKYNNVRLGYNSRLDTIQAAVLNAKFPQFISFELEAVNKVAKLYDAKLGSIDGIVTPTVLEGYTSSWAQYTVKFDAGINRDAVQEKLKEIGIPTMVYYKKPMHWQGAFKNTLAAQSECPVTENLCETVLCLPIHPYLEESEVGMICDGLRTVVTKMGSK